MHRREQEMTTKTIRTRKLGLAAYIGEKLGDSSLIGCDEHGLAFKSDRDLSEWALDYAASCCASHESRLVRYRDMLPKKRKR